MGGSGGPPPAEEDKIKALLHFKIGQDEVTNGMNKNNSSYRERFAQVG